MLRRSLGISLRFTQANMAAINKMASLRRYSTETFPPHTIIKMPALSPTMTQGNIGEWHKKIGDEISPGDILVEIETDKAQMDMECQDEGFLAKVFIESGGKDVNVNTPICVLAETKEDVAKFTSFSLSNITVTPAPVSTATPKESPEPTTPSKPSASLTTPTSQATPASSLSSRVFASPLAKAMATEKGIDLGTVQGTGPNGRIIKTDITNYKASVPSPALPTKSAYAAVPDVAGAYLDIPLSNVRKVIASRLAESKATIPHYYMTHEVDVTKVLKLREVLNSEANGKYKLSINDFVIKASSLALLDVPAMNSSWNGSFIRQFTNADVAVAVATETGLITPIVHKAQTLGLSKISHQTKLLAEKARAGKLAPHEYQGGTFTISNLGMYGVKHFTAIINPPHAAILAVGGVSDKLVLDESSPKGFKVNKVMNITVSPDHRVVDGAVAAQWVQKFQSYLENPLSMLL